MSSLFATQERGGKAAVCEPGGNDQLFISGKQVDLQGLDYQHSSNEERIQKQGVILSDYRCLATTHRVVRKVDFCFALLPRLEFKRKALDWSCGGQRYLAVIP